MSDQDKSLDVLGMKPIAEAAGHVTKAATDGAGAFLSRICLPAAEEFGLLLRDKVAHLRAENTRKILEKSQVLYEKQHGQSGAKIHPRLLSSILNEGSWEDDMSVQSMWAGLLASSCTIDGQDQENLIFIRLLGNITPSQASILDYACKNCRIWVGESGLVHADEKNIPRKQLLELFRISDVNKLDVALDHLREVGLLSQDSGLSPTDDKNTIEPSDMGLHFYARCQGHSGDLKDFYITEKGED